jgi:RHS repeat-associated protein
VSYVYEGFGKIVGQNGGEGGPYQFCGLWGYRNDNDAGLLHIGARCYEGETGRWVQKDSIVGKIYLPQTLNLYIYVINAPLNFIDPKGSEANNWEVIVKIITFYHPLINYEAEQIAQSVNQNPGRVDWWEVTKGIGLTVIGIAVIVVCATSEAITAGGAIAGIIAGSGFFSVGISKIISEFTK